MAADSPSPHRNVTNATNATTTPIVSPAQAIADAWNRETEDSREKWWRINEYVQKRFDNVPQKPDRTKM
jgi:hypothetical protein